MLVKELLGGDVTPVDIKNDVLDALFIMLGKRENTLPVLDGRRFAGTVDITSYTKILQDMTNRKPETISVGEIMSKKVRPVDPNTEISYVIDNICEKEVHGIPVTSGHELIGMVRRQDILRHYTPSLKGKFKVQDVMSYHVSTNSIHDKLEPLAKRILQGYERKIVIVDYDTIKGTIDILDLANVLLSEGIDLSRMSVKDILLPNAVSIGKYEDVTKAVQLMFEWKMEGIPVTDKNQVEGIVRDKDIIQRIKYTKDTA